MISPTGEFDLPEIVRAMDSDKQLPRRSRISIQCLAAVAVVFSDARTCDHLWVFAVSLLILETLCYPPNPPWLLLFPKNDAIMMLLKGYMPVSNVDRMSKAGDEMFSCMRWRCRCGVRLWRSGDRWTLWDQRRLWILETWNPLSFEAQNSIYLIVCSWIVQLLMMRLPKLCWSYCSASWDESN